MSTLPLPYQLSIFGTPLGAKFQLDQSRSQDGRILTGAALPAPRDNRFVAASGARYMPGQYRRHNPNLGAYHWRSGLSGLGQEGAPGKELICNQNCNEMFSNAGRATRCYGICMAATTAADCDNCNKKATGGFGPLHNRRGKCRQACTMSLTGAVVPTDEGFLPPGMGPDAPGMASTIIPIVAVGAAVLGLIYLIKRKKKS